MKSDSEQHQDFQMRLQRIANRSKTQTLFVGEDEVYHVPRRDRRVRRSGMAAVLVNGFYPVSMVLALAMGALGHAIGMWARFYVHGLHGWSEKPGIDMLVQLGVGFGLAMIFGYLIGLRSTVHTPLKLAGAALGVLFFHNAVHLYPEAFKSLTSAMWVSHVIGTTKAHSLLWMGLSFPF